MTPPGRFRIEPLQPAHLPEIAELWSVAHPLHPITETLLRERLFESPGADPALMLAARDEAGGLAGFTVGYFSAEQPRFTGVRWLSIAPEHLEARLQGGQGDLEGQGVAALLLDELCRRLVRLGAEKARMLGTAPYYLRPGIDTRETPLIAALLDLGWTHEATLYDLTVDLDRWTAPPEGSIFGPDPQGTIVRRARPEDLVPFREYMLTHWTPNWLGESTQAFRHGPISLFLALKDEEIVGFAAYEVSQCLGSFGPTGVSPEHRGATLGRRVLWACLADLKTLGRPRCEIGWAGPVSFYHRACGAEIGPIYWVLTRALTPEHSPPS